ADDLLRAARGARHGRPRAGHARGPDRPRAHARGGRRGVGRARRDGTGGMSATAEHAPAPAAPPSENGRSLVETGRRAREVSLLGVLAVLVLGTTLAEPRYLSSQNVRDILLNVSIVALLAVGQTVVVVTRNIDLSVGSVLGISAFAVGILFADHNAPIW